MSDRIEIDLSTLVFVGPCGDGALFEDGDGNEILFRATGNKDDFTAAACELRRAKLNMSAQQAKAQRKIKIGEET